jgi:hypothetical protein
MTGKDIAEYYVTISGWCFLNASIILCGSDDVARCNVVDVEIWTSDVSNLILG